MKLISMTDFVLHESFGVGNEIIDKGIFYNKCRDYANFLKQPLTLGMFVPCDEGGNVLEQPCDVMNTDGCRDCACRVYKKSKEKVLFENVEKYRFTSLSGEGVVQFGTRVNFIFKPLIETRNGIVKVFVNDINGLTDYDLELTQNAIKQLGL